MTLHDSLCFLLAGLILPAVGANMLGYTWPLPMWLLAFVLLLVFKPRRPT
jgi:hypothetical protein